MAKKRNSTGNLSRIVIIGAGISGLSCAALLAHRGFEVILIEKEHRPGGLASKMHLDGFTFDTGPTWYLMPDVFESLFNALDEPITEYLDLKKLEPSYKIFFNKHETYTLSTDMEHTGNVFASLEHGGSGKLKAYLSDARYKHSVSMKEFLYRDFNSPFDFLNWRLLSEGIRLGIFRNLDSFARGFFKSEKARKILEYNMVFLGCSPYKSPALYSLMSHVDLTQGVYYPVGGIYSLVESLYAIAQKKGVTFRFNESVTEIEIRNRRAVAARTGTGRIAGDVIVASCDYHHAESALIDSQYRNYRLSYWKKRTMAPSAFLVYLGIKGKIPDLEHHNLYLADNWKGHFQEIFDRPGWPENPSFYIGCPSKTDKTVALPGCEALFILVPIAPGLEDSNSIREQYYNKIIEMLERLLDQPFKNRILVKKIISVSDFRDRNNLYMGTALGLAHTLRQSACFRPSHRNRHVPNLLYAGHYTHPGIGMPMAVISGTIISDLINKYHG